MVVAAKELVSHCLVKLVVNPWRSDNGSPEVPAKPYAGLTSLPSKSSLLEAMYYYLSYIRVVSTELDKHLYCLSLCISKRHLILRAMAPNGAGFKRVMAYSSELDI
jgi:hypothetical protein